jgi:hypothetical protein
MTVYFFQNEEEFDEKIDNIILNVKETIDTNIEDIYLNGVKLLTDVKNVLLNDLNNLVINTDNQDLQIKLKYIAILSIDNAFIALNGLYNTNKIDDFSLNELSNYICYIIYYNLNEQLYKYIENI